MFLSLATVWSRLDPATIYIVESQQVMFRPQSYRCSIMQKDTHLHSKALHGILGCRSETLRSHWSWPSGRWLGVCPSPGRFYIRLCMGDRWEQGSGSVVQHRSCQSCTSFDWVTTPRQSRMLEKLENTLSSDTFLKVAYGVDKSYRAFHSLLDT